MTSLTEYVIGTALVFMLAGMLLVLVYIVFPRYYNGICHHEREWLLNGAFKLMATGGIIIIFYGLVNMISYLLTGGWLT